MYRKVRRWLSGMLWSTRISSSRQVVGSDTEGWKLGKPPFVPFACGKIASKNWELGSIPVNVSFANRRPVAGLTGQSGNSFVSITLGTGEQTSLKLPPRSASDGTFWL